MTHKWAVTCSLKILTGVNQKTSDTNFDTAEMNGADLEVLTWKYVEGILFSERENSRTFYTYRHTYILVSLHVVYMWVILTVYCVLQVENTIYNLL